MTEVQNISTKPTYDITDIVLLSVSNDGMCFLRSTHVYRFEKVYGVVTNRSRVLREGKVESESIENVVGAVVDAGFQGQLYWKLKLTPQGLTEYQKTSNTELFVESLRNAQQLLLWPIPTGNYYDGTNQTNLKPDILFQL
jgi:hypothetical protein